MYQCIYSLFVCALSDRLVVVKGRRWRLLAPHTPAIRGCAWRLCHKKPSHPHRGHYAFVLVPEVPVEQAIDDGIQAAVEVRHEIADHEEPLGDTRRHVGRIDSHCQANQVERRPADGKEHKDHKHGDKIPQVARPDSRGLLRLYFATHLWDTR